MRPESSGYEYEMEEALFHRKARIFPNLLQHPWARRFISALAASTQEAVEDGVHHAVDGCGGDGYHVGVPHAQGEATRVGFPETPEEHNGLVRSEGYHVGDEEEEQQALDLPPIAPLREPAALDLPEDLQEAERHEEKRREEAEREAHQSHAGVRGPHGHLLLAQTQGREEAQRPLVVQEGRVQAQLCAPHQDTHGTGRPHCVGPRVVEWEDQHQVSIHGDAAEERGAYVEAVVHDDGDDAAEGVADRVA